MAYPFDSGHVLALRVALQNDFAPYTSVWYRTPDGAWSIYVDGPRLDTACARYWGAATEHIPLTDITVEWTAPPGPRRRDGGSSIALDRHDAGWTARQSHKRDELHSPRFGTPVASRDSIHGMMSDLIFGLGDVTLAMATPNGQDTTVLTRRLFPIVDGHARMEGEDLGQLATEADNPTIGEAHLPARPVFTIGRAYLTIVDDTEYERTVDEVWLDWNESSGFHGRERCY